MTKGFGPEAVIACVHAGLDRVGENYAQEAVDKIAGVRAGGVEVTLHFIGRLQTNKVRMLAPVVDVWQSLDRDSVVDEVAKRAPAAKVFVQVNATGEPDKGGCPLDKVDLLVERAHLRGLDVLGLMTVGPTHPDPMLTRAAFRATRSCVDRLGLAECSMGMSDDLEIAVQEGSTQVRIGTALLGPRGFGGDFSRLA